MQHLQLNSVNSNNKPSKLSINFLQFMVFSMGNCRFHLSLDNLGMKKS